MPGAPKVRICSVQRFGLRHHLPREQHRGGVCDDRRDSTGEFLRVFFINQCNARFLTISFSSDYSRGCYRLIVKSNKCFETDPDAWRDVNEDGLQLLSLLDLKRYRNKFLDEKNLQDKWEAAMTNPDKYVNLLVGQRDDEDLWAETDKENHYDSSLWDQKTKNFCLAYHQVKAQAHWFASKPNEAEHYEVPGKDLRLIFACANVLAI
jgi:hypothetical protein